MKLKPHSSISQLHLLAGERENCFSVISCPTRNPGLTSLLLCLKIAHYTSKSTRSRILPLLCHKREGEAPEIWTAANCFVFYFSRKEKKLTLAEQYMLLQQDCLLFLTYLVYKVIHLLLKSVELSGI